MDIETFNAMSERDQKMHMARLALADYFSREDVAAIRQMAKAHRENAEAYYGAGRELAEDDARLVASVADRIEALLPPR